jgi:hypothetical protein
LSDIMKRYNGTAPWTQPTPWAPGDIETSAPARAADIKADLLVPLGQALVTGAFVGGLGIMAAVKVQPGVDALAVWVIVSGLVATGVWVYLLRESRRLLWQRETVTGRDLNGDGVIGQPVALPPLRVEVTSGQKQIYLELPGKPEALAMLARGVLAGRPMAEDSWSGGAGPFSRSEFRAIRDTLIERGLATWRNPDAKAQGCELTHAGRAMFRRLADLAK